MWDLLFVVLRVISSGFFFARADEVLKFTSLLANSCIMTG